MSNRVHSPVNFTIVHFPALSFPLFHLPQSSLAKLLKKIIFCNKMYLSQNNSISIASAIFTLCLIDKMLSFSI